MRYLLLLEDEVGGDVAGDHAAVEQTCENTRKAQTHSAETTRTAARWQGSTDLREWGRGGSPQQMAANMDLFSSLEHRDSISLTHRTTTARS